MRSAGIKLWPKKENVYPCRQSIVAGQRLVTVCASLLSLQAVGALLLGALCDLAQDCGLRAIVFRGGGVHSYIANITVYGVLRDGNSHAVAVESKFWSDWACRLPYLW